MPTNYSNAYPWVQDYIYGNTNLLSLAVNGDNTPRVIFPTFLQQTLLQNHPGVSVDDIGVKIFNRQHYYARWQDFPTPDLGDQCQHAAGKSVFQRHHQHQSDADQHFRHDERGNLQPDRPDQGHLDRRHAAGGFAQPRILHLPDRHQLRRKCS